MNTKKDRLGYIHNIPENEIKNLNRLMDDVNYLANREKPETSKYAEFPNNFMTEFEKRRKQNSEEQK